MKKLHVLLFCLKKTQIAIYDEILMHIGRQSMDEILAHKKPAKINLYPFYAMHNQCRLKLNKHDLQKGVQDSTN